MNQIKTKSIIEQLELKKAAKELRKQSHTPPPWTVQQLSEYGEYWIMEAAQRQSEAGDSRNAKSIDEAMLEDQKNCYLISAAPDLLAACEALLSNPCPFSIEQAQAAISKAKGESK